MSPVRGLRKGQGWTVGPLSRGAQGPYSRPVVPRLFVSNPTFDECLDSGAIQTDGVQLTLEALPELNWTLRPAVLVTELDEDGPEPPPSAKELVGRVCTSEDLDKLNAEHFGTAVVIGDLAYTVRPGFVIFAEEIRQAGGLGVQDVLQLWDDALRPQAVTQC